jgi:hypothetical protein
MQKVTYTDETRKHSVTAVKRSTRYGERWHVTGSFIKERGEWLQLATFDKWVRHWQENGLIQA